MNEVKGKGRLIVFLIIILSLVVVLAGRYAYLMLFLPAQSAEKPVVVPPVERGPILDRNGKILAITTTLDSVGGWIPDLRNVEETVPLLSEILDMDEEQILALLSSTDGFAPLKRLITPTESARIRALMNEGRLPGIKLDEEFGRNYPLRNSAAHLVGYVNVDNVGLDGIESSFQAELSPAIMGEGIEYVYGNQIFLTIDANVQHAMESIAHEAMLENMAESVMLLAMDARTGEIVAYVSLPDFDPNVYPGKEDYSESALYNRPARMAYEPGSVFKIYSLASFLQLGGISTADRFLCEGVYDRVEPPIRDLRAHGTVDARDILKYSCNVGAAYASETVDAGSFHRMLQLFGFGRRTGVPLAGENSGGLKAPSEWSVRTKPTIAFGQEINVTALQMISGATVFCNGGVLLKPLLVRKIVSPEGILIKEYGREEVARVLDPETAAKILLMMESATSAEGTARLAAIEGMRISAKTGTAQKYDSSAGRYSEDRHVASFLGIFPTDDPRLILYVVVDSPRVELDYGSRVAAPIFRQAALKLISLLDIPLTGETTLEHSGRLALDPAAIIAIGDEMPDLTGTAKRSLLPLLQREDLRILFQGEGYVVRQNPAPGEPVKTGMSIRLEFE